MLGKNRPLGKVDLSVVIQKKLAVGISVHGLFIREIDTLEKAESRIMETRKQFMLKREAMERLSPEDDIDAVISYGLNSGKGKSKNEKKMER